MSIDKGTTAAPAAAKVDDKPATQTRPAQMIAYSVPTAEKPVNVVQRNGRGGKARVKARLYASVFNGNSQVNIRQFGVEETTDDDGNVIGTASFATAKGISLPAESRLMRELADHLLKMAAELDKTGGKWTIAE